VSLRRLSGRDALGYVRSSNSPALTPAMNARHSAAVYRSTGLASPSLVSRSNRPPFGRSATSTHVPLLL
jgi:hypothetical protein